MEKSIKQMMKKIVNILGDNEPSIYLYGSITVDDFKLGWSDIDFLCLTKKSITKKQADQLLNLRQFLIEDEPDNKYYRLFEGAFLSLNTFCQKSEDIVVYWGTTGQRITDVYHFNSFSMISLLIHGRLICGQDFRSQFKYPTDEELKMDIGYHLQTIRQVAVKTNRSLYSAGWLFDIARCIYTIRTGSIIAKTTALEWALEQGLCPDNNVAVKAISLRKNPNLIYYQEEIQLWLESLGDEVQKFANVLEFELNKGV